MHLKDDFLYWHLYVIWVHKYSTILSYLYSCLRKDPPHFEILSSPNHLISRKNIVKHSYVSNGKKTLIQNILFNFFQDELTDFKRNIHFQSQQMRDWATFFLVKQAILYFLNIKKKISHLKSPLKKFLSHNMFFINGCIK